MSIRTDPAGWAARSRLLGPAFVAAVAYVDPGNVATNTTAGASYGYLLLWVLVVAILGAGLVQYLSAKLGWITGASLPELVAGRTRRTTRLAYWAQAEVVAIATDLAEIVGGAIALQLLFGLPVVLGAVLTAVVSTTLLFVADRKHEQRAFEHVINGLLVLVLVGFLAGLFVAPPNPAAAAAGLLPRLRGSGSLLLAVGMIGATIMPHAVYLHSALVRDRHGQADEQTAHPMLRIQRIDVTLAMVLAGAVNIGMLLLAASALGGHSAADLVQIHAGLADRVGGAVATLFALGLLASGLASTAVGGYAGSVIMAGLLKRHVPLLARRAITAIPAVILLAAAVDPTQLLVVSQVVLSFGIPMALVPLVRIVADRRLMALAPTRRITIVVAWLVVAVVVVLNLALIVLTVLGP